MVSEIDDKVKEKLNEFIKNGDEILIGDCWGTDTSVQKFLVESNYKNVTVYASGDKVRNNVGRFKVHKVKADDVVGFDFYRSKDIAMADEADCGYMIWDGKSKGTLHNIIDLNNRNKPVEIYRTDK